MRLYIPVETVARELDAKLLLSLFAVERGLTVVLGNRALMSRIIHRFEPGIFLSHNFDRKRRRLLRIVKDLGHVIVAWDEEGLVWVSPEVYRQRRVDPTALEMIDSIFAWGEQHGKALGPATGPSGVAVIQAGNPRADLLRPEMRRLYQERVDSLRVELGPFVLINSNFGWLNHALDRNAAGKPGDDDIPNLAIRSGHCEGFLRFRLAVFRAFIEVLPLLSAACPDRTIVIRPHPSEDPAGWLAAAAGLKNVCVRYDDDLVPWLLAADAIIHNGCTTAVEAAMLGRRPIMYRPVDGGQFEIRQPLSVSQEARTPGALLAALSGGAEANHGHQEAAQNLQSLVSGLSGKLCAETIADAISGLTHAQPPLLSKPQRIAARAKSMIRGIEKSCSAMSKSSPSHPDYIARKFPPMPVEAIERRMRQLASLLERPTPAITKISDRIFEIRAATEA